MLKPYFYICVAFLSLGQFSVISKIGDTNVYLFDLAVLSFAFLGLFFLLINRSLFIPKFLWGFAVFSFVAVCSILFQSSKLPSVEFLRALFYLVRWLGYLFASLVVFNMMKQNILSEWDFVRTTLFSAVFVSLAGFIQLIILPDFSVLDPSLGWDPHKNRLASVFFDPNFTGAYLIICLIVLASWRGKIRNWVIFLMALIVTAIFLTFSRSSWAMLSVVVLFFGMFRYRWLLLVSLVIAFSAYFFVPRVQTRISGTTDPSDSARFRLISWGNTWNIARDNLALGVGFNAFRNAQREYGYVNVDTVSGHSATGSDSSLLLVLATTGLVGLLFFMMGILNFRSLGLTALNGGLLIHSLFVNSLFFPPIMFLWLTSLAYFNCFYRK